MYKTFIKVDIREELYYFFYIIYEINGIDILIKIVKNETKLKELNEKLSDLKMERDIIIQYFFDKYGLREIANKYQNYLVTSSLQDNLIEIEFSNEK